LTVIESSPWQMKRSEEPLSIDHSAPTLLFLGNNNL
jgi:hypothetical protein